MFEHVVIRCDLISMLFIGFIQHIMLGNMRKVKNTFFDEKDKYDREREFELMFMKIS